MQPVLTTPQPARHPHPLTKASSLAHLVFERPDLELAERFLADFGLVVAQRTQDVIYLRGAGPAAYCYRIHRGARPRFAGFGINVPTAVDVRTLAGVAGASKIEESPHPGGGTFTSLRDPSGFIVEALYGRTDAEHLNYRAPLSLNQGVQPTRINSTQRPPARPPEIYKLGHIVLEVADYQKTCEWYTYHFGFIPSDVQVLPDGSPVVTFMRLDLGGKPADHHTMAIAQGFAAAYSHSAYEVVDADAIGMGQKILRDGGWKHAWGIGRHVLGSQLFDYWQDPWGDKHEHYCDGDMFTAEKPMGIELASAEAMAQWGQRMPASFTRPKMSLETIAGFLRSLRHSPDVTLKKVIALAKLFAV